MRATSSLRSFLSSLKQEKRAASPAFTIVELLIVIVIIAILAAITLVSYNGIQQRAKASSAQSLLSQAVNKVKLYAIDHSDQYPSSLTDAGITDTTNLQYSSTSSTYCITATAQNLSYYQNTTTDTPTKGACPGHGVDGGGVVTNYVPNPRSEYNNTSWAWSAWAGPGGTASISIMSDGGYLSNSYYRIKWTSSATDVGGNVGLANKLIPVDGNAIYMASLYTRVSAAQNMVLVVFYYDSSGNTVATGWGSENYITPGSWQRLSYKLTTPNTTTTLNFRVRTYDRVPQANDTIDVDAAMLTKGPTLYPYADPLTSSSWIWNGTVNNSTSTGPISQ